MSTKSEIHSMNESFRTELGTEKEYRWVHSFDERGRMAFQVFDTDQSPVFDYYCKCGKNVRIHTPQCTSFVIPKPRYELKSVIPKNCWALCVRQQPDKQAWERMLPGLPYPNKGSWSPVGSNAKRLVLKENQLPTWKFTREFIQAVRESRELGWDYVENRQKKAEEDWKDRAHNKNMSEVEQYIGVRAFPGKVDGSVSLPTSETEKKRYTAKESAKELVH